MPALSAKSVKNGQTLTFQALVSAEAGVARVEAIIPGVETIRLLPQAQADGQTPNASGAAIYQTVWNAHGLEEKIYTVTFRVTDTLGRVAEDASLSFSDPMAGNSSTGSQAYPPEISKPHRIDSLFLAPTEKLLFSAVADTAAGYAYFGVDNNTGVVVKVRTSDMTRVGVLTLEGGEGSLRCAALDAPGGYIYFGTESKPAKVVKVRTSDFTRVGALSFDPGENYVRSAVIDPTRTYAYFGTNTSPAKLIKIRLSDFTRVGTLTLNAGDDNVDFSVIDPSNQYLYAGTRTTPARVIKVRLSDFSRVSALTLGNDSSDAICGAIDPQGTNLMVGVAPSGSNLAKVCKIRLSDFSLQGTYTTAYGTGAPSWITSDATGTYFYGCFFGSVIKLRSSDMGAQATMTPTGFSNMKAMAMDSDYSNLYVGTYNEPGQIAKIRLSDFTQVGTPLTLQTGEDVPATFLMAPDGNYAYAGTYTTPARVIKIRLSDFTKEAVLKLGAGEDNIVSGVMVPGTNTALWGTGTNPGKVIKVDLSTMTKAGVLPLASGDDTLYGATIDPTGTYAYFGTYSVPARIIKVNVGTLVREDSFDASVNNITCAAISPDGLYAYFGSADYPGMVDQVYLPDFFENYVYPLESGQDSINGIAIDPTGNYAYCVLYSDPGRVVKLNLLSTMVEEVAVFNEGESCPGQAALDPNGEYLYTSDWNAPNNMVRVKLSPLGRDGVIQLNPGEGGPVGMAFSPDGRRLYAGSASSPGSIIRTALGPNDAIHATKFVMPEEGAVYNLKFYSHQAGGHLRLAIYDNNTPRQLLWQSPELNNIAPGWSTVNTLTGTPNLISLPAGTYWLAFSHDAKASIGSYTAGNPGDGFMVDHAFGSFPSSIDTGKIRSNSARWSIYLNYTPPVSAPAAPSNPGATGIQTNQITWTWTDNSDNENGFEIWADAGPDNPKTIQPAAAAGATQWTMTELTPGTQYTFKVAATGEGGSSAATAPYTAWTLAATPVAPVLGNATSRTIDVAIGDGDGNSDATEYAIYCDTAAKWVQADGTLGDAAVWQTKAAWATKTVTGLAQQTAYQFLVRARNGAGVETANGSSASASTGLPTSGELNHLFGHHGVASYSVTGSELNWPNIAVYPATSASNAGKVVILGDGNEPDKQQYVSTIMRLNANGTLDTSFNGIGIQKVDLGAASGANFCEAVMIQPDDKILVLVQHRTNPLSHLAVIRINANGTLDTTFNGNGIFVTTIDGKNTYGWGIAVQKDGKIVVSGSYGASGAEQNSFVARIAADGSGYQFYPVDMTTFIGNSGDQEVFNSVALDDAPLGAQSIYVTGGAKTGSTSSYNYKVTAAKLDSNGTVVWKKAYDYIGTAGLGSIGGDIAYHDFGGSIGQRVVIGGGQGGTSYNNFTEYGLLMLKPSDGTLDTNFSTDGKATINIGGRTYWERIAIQNDHKIIVGGSNSGTFECARFNPDGSLDTTFAKNGIVTYTPPNYGTAQEYCLDGNGDLVVASITYDDSWTSTFFTATSIHARDKVMEYSVTEVGQNSDPISRNQIGDILEVKVCVDGSLAPLSATSFSFNTAGSTNPSGDIVSAQLYYTGSRLGFSTGNPVGAPVIAPNGAFTINVNQPLVHGDNRFWLAYKTSGNPTMGNQVDAQCTAVTVDGVIRTPVPTSPDGARTIQAPSYPEISGDNSTDWISNVTFAGINNTTSKGASGYDDQTAVEGTVTVGTSVPFSCTNMGDWAGDTKYPSTVLVWCDWNRNCSFDDPGEFNLVATKVTASGPHATTINVPMDATAGKTRMRVITYWDDNRSYPNRKNLGYGEAEDYTLNVLALTPSAPSKPGVTNPLINSLTWTWMDNSSDETGFKVWADAGGTPPTTLRVTTDADATQWTMAELTPNTQYTFKVAATNENGDSAATDPVSAWTAIEPVSGLAFTNIGLNSIDVATLNTPSNLADGGSGIRLANTTAGTESGWRQEATPWRFSSLTPNTTYHFSGTARNAEGLETTPATASKTTLAALPTVGLNLMCSKSILTYYPGGTNFIFSNPMGFGSGTHAGNPNIVSGFRYVWDTVAGSHAFTGSETVWNSNPLTFTPPASGEYYLHVQSLNSEGVGNPLTLDYGPFRVDNVAPAVESVSVPAPGTYKAGQKLSFTVRFTETVTLDGSGGYPTLSLAMENGGTVAASYEGRLDSKSLTFGYIVAPGNMDSNGITVGPLSAGASTIQDAAGNDANLTLNGVVSTAAVLVDAVVPGAPGTPSAGGAVQTGKTVTFTWTAASDMGGSGIASYDCQIGTTAGAGDVFSGNIGNVLTWSEDGNFGTSYYCRVRAIDAVGNIGAWSAVSAGVLVAEAPAITKDPSPRTLSPGDTATFTVEASGTALLQYQWQKDGVALSDDGRISGTHSATLSIANLDMKDAGNYHCVVTNPAGEAQSQPARLTVNPTLTVTSTHGTPNPVVGAHVLTTETLVNASLSGSPELDSTGTTRYVATGWTGTGSVSASGATTETSFKLALDSTLAWQWKTQYQLTVAAMPADGGTVALEDGVTAAQGSWHDAATTATLRALPAAGYAFGGWEGALEGSSTTASLAMDAPRAVTAVFIRIPYLIRQPVSQFVNAGDTVAFEVEAQGTAPLAYAWHKNGLPLGEDARVIDVATARLTINKVGYSDEGQYTCIVTNAGGSTESLAATLAINDAPAIDPGTPGSYEENASPAPVAPDLALSDADHDTLTGAVVSITAGLTAGDALAFTPQGGIAGSYNSVTGTLTLSGAATVADYQAVLRSVTFVSSSDDPARLSASRTIAFMANDGMLASQAAAVSFTINAVNDNPVALELNGDTVTENQPAGTAVGDFSATDLESADTHTYALVSGVGDADNDGFQIVENHLVTATALDYETQSAHSIRVRVSDNHGGTFERTFVISVKDANDAPTALTLDTAAVYENATTGTLVGILSATDQDASDMHGYALVAGEGDADNGVFTLDGNKLMTARVFDHEAQSSATIRLRASDGQGGSVDRSVIITILDVNEGPVAMADLYNADEDTTLTVAAPGVLANDGDPDTSDTLRVVAYDPVSKLGVPVSVDAQGGFTYDPTSIDALQMLPIGLGVVDSFGLTIADASGITATCTVTIVLDGRNDAPTAIALKNDSVTENQPAGTVVGSFSIQDRDTIDTHTLELVKGEGDTDNASFMIVEKELQTAAEFDYEAKPSYSIRVRASDGHGGSFEQTFTITVGDANDAPSAIQLSNAVVGENLSFGTPVGTLTVTDQDAANSHEFTLVPGVGDTGNGLFSIVGGQLVTNATFDYETKSSYLVRVQASDGQGGSFEQIFTIGIADANDAPAELMLSQTEVAENQPAGTVVGVLSASDQDKGDTLEFTLVAGKGGTDNASFSIVGDRLCIAAPFNFEDRSSYTIRVRVSDGQGGSYERGFLIAVTDANDAPEGLALDNAAVDENATSGTLVGMLSATDQDSADTPGYALVDGEGDADNGSFVLDGNQLKTARVFDFEVQSSATVRLRVSDKQGGTQDRVFTIAVRDLNENPTALDLSGATVAENRPIGTLLGRLTATDQDSTGTYTFSLVAGPGGADNDSFTISGDQLKTAAVFNHEARSSHAIRVRTEDGHGGVFERTFTIQVTDVNETPTALALSGNIVAERQPAGTVVGTLSTTDEDSADSHEYELVAGEGGLDNASFTINGNQLRTADAFDYEVKASFSIRVRVSDGHGASFEQSFAIQVTDANDAPTALALDNASVYENATTGTLVGILTATDQDASDKHTFKLVSGLGDLGNSSFVIAGNQLATARVFDHEVQSTTSVRLRASDGRGGSVDRSIIITILDVNEGPVAKDDLYKADEDTTLTVAAPGVLANDGDPDTTDTLLVVSYQPVGSLGGIVKMVDAAGGFEYNASALPQAQALNKGQSLADSFAYTVADQAGTTASAQVLLTVLGVNDDPSALMLDATNVAENRPAGTVIGSFSVEDCDATDTHTIELVAGDGGADNASFSIVDGKLQTAAPFDYEKKSSYAIRARVSDGNGGSFEQPFTIGVTDVNDAPTAIQLTNARILENQPAGTPVGMLNVSDQDSGDTHLFSLVDGADGGDNASFKIEGNVLKSAAVFDNETRKAFSIRVRVSDGRGGVFEQPFEIAVENVNEVPATLTLTGGSVAENQPAGTLAGTLATKDPDSGDALTYTLVSGAGDAGNGSFAIDGNRLITATSFDYESVASLPIRVRVSDAGGLTLEKNFTVAVTNGNDAPVELKLDNTSVAEKKPADTLVGKFSTVDPDTGDTHGYALAAGAGDTDNARFRIVGASLLTAASFDIKTQGHFSIRVETSDGKGGRFARQFSITLTPAADTEPPAFSVGPLLVSLSSRQAIVRWETSEPATAVLGYGKTAALGTTITMNQAASARQVELNGLTSQTQYFVQVAVRDAAGNGPVLGTLLTFTTPADPDLTPPVINEGPLATTVNDTYAEIRWTTNEASTSKVIYSGGDTGGVREDGAPVLRHSILLTGLKPSTVYTYTVESADTQGNGPARVGPLSFRTLPTPDKQKPVITEGPLVVGLSDNGATLSWRTDEPATSVVEWGTTSATLPVRVASAKLTQGHQMILSNLAPGTRHWFRVSSFDAYGNGPTSSSLASFMTDPAPDMAPPRILEGPTVVAVANHSATIQWRTDEPADSVITYGKGDALDLRQADPARVTEHQLTLVNLTPGTLYRFVISSTDASGNTVQTTLGGNKAPARMATRPSAAARAAQAPPTPEFTTAALPDLMAPVFTIAPYVTSIGDTSAIVTWQTDEIGDARIEFGTATLDRFIGEIERKFDHVMILTNLTPATPYQVRVSTQDISGNIATSQIINFTTAAEPDRVAPILSGVTVGGISVDAAAVAWQTGELATSQVIYGTAPDALNRITALAGMRQAHGVNLTNLLDGTTYYYAVISTDAAGNTAQSAVRSFTTPHVIQPADLALALNVARTTVTAGESIMAGLTITNQGATAVGDAKLTVTLPAHVSVAMVTDPAAGSHVLSDGKCVFTLGSLAPGAMVQAAIRLTVEDTLLASPPLAINASLDTGGIDWTDVNPVNNMAVASILFSPPKGSITIEPNPLTASWHLTGPDTNLDGSGARTLTGVTLGSYTITWKPLAGWSAPAAQTRNLTLGASLTLKGTYTPKRTECLTISLPKGSRYQIGDLMEVKWTSKVPITGTAVDIELWHEGAFVRERGRVWSSSGSGVATIRIPALPASSKYRVRIVSVLNRAFWVDSGAVTFTGEAVSVSTPAVTRPYRTGDSLTVTWKTIWVLAGSAVKLDLCNERGEQIAPLGYAWSEACNQALSVKIPVVPTGKYQVIATSCWDVTLWNHTGLFAIQGRNAVEPGAWNRYE